MIYLKITAGQHIKWLAVFFVKIFTKLIIGNRLACLSPVLPLYLQRLQKFEDSPVTHLTYSFLVNTHLTTVQSYCAFDWINTIKKNYER